MKRFIKKLEFKILYGVFYIAGAIASLAIHLFGSTKKINQWRMYLWNNRIDKD